MPVQPSHPSNLVDEVGRSGVYPLSGPLPPGDAIVRGQGELAHPEERHRHAAVRRSWTIERTLLLLGRGIFGGYFAYNGINHLLNGRMLSEYARSKQVPLAPAAVAVSGAMLIAGGLSVMTGTRPKLGASLISAFLAGVSPQMHAFWSVEDEQQRMQELVNFTKNVALMGAACFVAAQPEPWPFSIRARGGALAASHA